MHWHELSRAFVHNGCSIEDNLLILSRYPLAVGQVLDMLHKDDCRLKETAARILSHAGASARSEAATALDEAKEKLLHLCEHGSAKAAKAAVRCGTPLALKYSKAFACMLSHPSIHTICSLPPSLHL